MKQKPVCGSCGSEYIKVDADAVWNSDIQRYELGAVYDDAYCAECGSHGCYDLILTD